MIAAILQHGDILDSYIYMIGYFIGYAISQSIKTF